MRGLKAIVNRAKADGLLPDGTSATVDERPEDIKSAADRLWSIGLVQLRKAIGEGQWIPTQLDLTIEPRDNLVLTIQTEKRPPTKPFRGLPTLPQE